MNIAVIGAGSWGTAIANLLAEKGYQVKLWAREPELAALINQRRQNPRYLDWLKLDSKIQATGLLDEALNKVEVVAMAVPSHAMRDTLLRIKQELREKPTVISLTKGLEINTLMRMSEIIVQIFPDLNDRIGVLSGPNHAEEVGKHIPSATVVSSTNTGTAGHLQELFMTPYFRVYTNSDIVGVELGAATKNVIAIAAGISDGLGYGDNTKASLMTRGLAEMTRLGVAAGARQLTFAGLSGVGDLIVTCTSRYSRNRAAGERLAKGATLAEISGETQMVAEGINTSIGICKLADKFSIEMPISKAVCQVIYEGKNPYECVQELMGRGATDELEVLS